MLCLLLLLPLLLPGQGEEIRVNITGREDRREKALSIFTVVKVRQWSNKLFLVSRLLFCSSPILAASPALLAEMVLATHRQSALPMGITDHKDFIRMIISHNRGISSGSCASGFGVCCVFEKSCGGSSSENVTYFTSSSRTLGGSCSLTVCKVFSPNF